MATAEWQPIETAPRDGTYIIVPDSVGLSNIGVITVRWMMNWRNQSGWSVDEYSSWLKVQPRYWLPIPPIPAEK